MGVARQPATTTRRNGYTKSWEEHFSQGIGPNQTPTAGGVHLLLFFSPPTYPGAAPQAHTRPGGGGPRAHHDMSDSSNEMQVHNLVQRQGGTFFFLFSPPLWSLSSTRPVHTGLPRTLFPPAGPMRSSRACAFSYGTSALILAPTPEMASRTPLALLTSLDNTGHDQVELPGTHRRTGIYPSGSYAGHF